MYKTIEEFLNGNFKKDYSEGNPEDYQLDKIKNVTYKEILVGLSNGKDIYDIIGDVDSVIREELFNYMEYDLNELGIKIDYDDFYYLWLRDEKRIGFKDFENKYLK